MTVYTVLWLLWLAYFLVVEGVALFNSRPGDTLSEHVWLWFGTEWRKGQSPRERSGWTQLRRVLLAAFMVWLTVHFLTGGWM